MGPRPTRQVLTLLTAAAVAAGLSAVAAQPALATAPAPASAGGDPTQHVLVLLRNQHPEAPADAGSMGRRTQLVAADQAPLVAQARGSGGRDVRQLHVANAFAAAVSPTEATTLAGDPAVAAVLPDRLVAAPTQHPDRPATGAAPGPVSSSACPAAGGSPQLEPEALTLTHTASADPATPSAQQTATGRGVRVAFLADGIDTANPDFVRPDGSHVFTDYQDFSGDGPNAATSGGEAFGDASAIAAQGRQSYDLSRFVSAAHPLPAGCAIRVLGMAPDASLIGLKVFPAGGFAFNSAILAALDWAVTVDHADVISESFGSNQFPDTGDDPTALFNEQLVAAGVTVLASSGDAGPFDTIGSPASSPGVISVGGTTMFRGYAQTTSNGVQLGNGRFRDDGISALSSSGTTQPGRTIDLVAPGDLGWAVCTPDPARFAACVAFNGTPASIELFGGTSQSAPLTAGAAALVIQSYRDTHGGATPAPALVRELLTSTADDLGLPGNEQGAGLLNSLRAVAAARSAPDPAGHTPGGAATDLLAAPQQLDLTSSADVATGRQTVTNLSDRPRLVHAEVRSTSHVLDQRTQTVALSSTVAQTPDNSFVDQRGNTRIDTRASFTVAPGASRVSATIAWPGAGARVVRLVLLDPDGTYSAYSLPQGAGDFATVDVPAPTPGRWTAILYTNPGAAGFSGNISLTTASLATTPGGLAVPSDFLLGPGRSRTVAVIARQPQAAGDSADALVLSGRAAGSTGRSTTVVPIVLRRLVDLGRRGSASIDSSFAGGNGRAGIPNPAQTFAFDVPPGARDLSVGMTVTGNPGQVMYGFLVDPNGQPLSERTNQRRAAGGTISLVDGLQLTHAAPQPGRWQFTFAIFGPVAGTATATPFHATVALNTVRATGGDVPADPKVRLPAGRPVTASVAFTNTGSTDAAYFVDGRLDARADLPLVVANPAYTLPGAPQAPFPAVRVPTQSDALSVSATSDTDVNFEVSPFPADHVTDLSFEGDPDRIAGPNGRAPSVTVTDPEIAAQPWLALPTTIGPFAGPGPTAHLAFTASAHTRRFDAAVVAGTGDPLLSSVDPSAPAAAPAVVAAGADGRITVTFTPAGPAGTVVRGTLYLDTIDAVTGGTDELAAVPYAYTVG